MNLPSTPPCWSAWHLCWSRCLPSASIGSQLKTDRLDPLHRHPRRPPPLRQKNMVNGRRMPPIQPMCCALLPSRNNRSECTPDTINRGRKAGSTIGSVAGATSGMAIALSGAEAGMTLVFVAGPVGSLFGGLAGAVIAGLVGSAAGCAAGSAVGAAIDDNVLDNHQCLKCGHAFSAVAQ